MVPAAVAIFLPVAAETESICRFTAFTMAPMVSWVMSMSRPPVSFMLTCRLSPPEAP